VFLSLEGKTPGQFSACNCVPFLYGDTKEQNRRPDRNVAQHSEIKILSDNRSASHHYHLLDRYETRLGVDRRRTRLSFFVGSEFLFW
jgi:hypothetical protein